MSKKGFGIWMLGLGLLCAALPCRVKASAFEHYLLVFPLQPVNHSAQQEEWFGPAFRMVLAEAALAMKTVIFVQDDELKSVQAEYHLADREPDPGQMEKIADDKDIAVLYGTYQVKDQQLILTCQIIPGRNSDSQSFKASSGKNELTKVFAVVMKNTVSALDLTLSQGEAEAIRHLPGTDRYEAFHSYYRALALREAPAQKQEATLAAMPWLEKSLQLDPDFVPALARHASWLLQTNEKPQKQRMAMAKQNLDHGVRLQADHPLLQNAQLEYLLAARQYQAARELGKKNLAQHPVNYKNYLLLAAAERGLEQPEAAEKVLLQALELQGTDLQKKPFQLELGLLALNRNDQQAENYLDEVLQLEPENVEVRFYRAAALCRLKRYMDAMTEIQQLETVKTWKEEKVLKAQTALALGKMFFEEGEFDRAYSFTAMALNLQPGEFESAFLLAKTLRKKGLPDEARQQLVLAQKAIRRDHAKDHLWLGTEFVAQGDKTSGAKEYIAYLKINPKAPERSRLIPVIRKLQGEADE